jgi:hypothetical protein
MQLFEFLPKNVKIILQNISRILIRQLVAVEDIDFTLNVEGIRFEMHSQVLTVIWKILRYQSHFQERGTASQSCNNHLLCVRKSSLQFSLSTNSSSKYTFISPFAAFYAVVIINLRVNIIKYVLLDQ